MKKIFGMMSLLAVIVGLVGCAGNNNDDDDGSNEDIVGMWWFYSYLRGGDWRFNDDEDIIDFREDGTYIIWEHHRKKEEGRWNCDGDIVKIKNEKEEYEKCIKIEIFNDTVMYVGQCEGKHNDFLENGVSKLKKVNSVSDVHKETDRIERSGRKVEQW